MAEFVGREAFVSINQWVNKSLRFRDIEIRFEDPYADDPDYVVRIMGLSATDTIVAEMPPEMFDQFATTNQLVHRTGQVDDIVAGMLFLCSDEASFITGETLKISGGFPLSI